jgi:hypothetical protein
VLNRLETAANASYHALQASLNGQWRRVTLRTAYTWSKFMDEVSDFPSSNTGVDRGLLALDERNWKLNRAVSDFDMRHVLSVAYVWDLPWSGWSIQGITSLQSGRPYTLFSGTDTPDGNNSNRIVHIPGALLRDPSSRTAIALTGDVTRAQLSPARGVLGNIGRNTERADGLVSWNASVAKSFALGERARLQVRAEVFNAMNTTNYNPPDGVLSSPTFGQATSALDPRQIQLAMRFSF